MVVILKSLLIAYLIPVLKMFEDEKDCAGVSMEMNGRA